MKFPPLANVIELFCIIYMSVSILPKVLTCIMLKILLKKFYEIDTIGQFYKKNFGIIYIGISFDLYYVAGGIYSAEKSFMKPAPGEQASFAGLKKRIISLISVLCGENWARDMVGLG
jgi:hypothetical protein